jgi:hypothetical protein
MKRTNVIVEEEVLEEARRLSGEKTYSATINRALQEMVRRREGQQAARRLMELLDQPDAFYPGYAEELYGEEWVRKTRQKLKANGWTVREDRPARKPSKVVAAMKVSAPKKRRGSRR